MTKDKKLDANEEEYRDILFKEAEKLNNETSSIDKKLKEIEQILGEELRIVKITAEDSTAGVSYEYIDWGDTVIRVKKHFIPIDEIKILIAREITIANSEGQPTSRLTSLYGKLPIDKSKEENK